MEKFSYGVSNRASSVRIPVTTVLANKGFYEDRRPASNVDPYLCTSIMVDTTLLNSKYTSAILESFKYFKKVLKWINKK